MSNLEPFDFTPEALADLDVTGGPSAGFVPIGAESGGYESRALTLADVLELVATLAVKGDLDENGYLLMSQIPAALLGGVKYQGTWNASTNSPTLANGTGLQGAYYKVSTAGTTNLDGTSSWAIGDWAIFNGEVWEKVDNTDSVLSVNGLTGTVVVDDSNINAQDPSTGGTVRTLRAVNSNQWAVLSNHKARHGLSGPDQLNLDATQLTTGTIPFARVPFSSVSNSEDGAATTVVTNPLGVSLGIRAMAFPPFAALTDAATIIWDYQPGAKFFKNLNATLILGGNHTLSIVDAASGSIGTLIVIQNATGGWTLTLPAGSKIAGGASIDTAANAISKLTFIYDGTTYFWTIEKYT